MSDFQWLSYGISHGYITSYKGPGTDTPHYANDIGTPYHTPVTALFSGTVKSQRTGLAWGTEIFIKPDDSSVSEYYYYHLDVLQTKVGQHVNAGDVIGLSGGQNSGGSNPTTPEYSSGPHTHVGFFTEWVLTTIGTRPYGPDITPYIQALSSGQTLPSGSSSDNASSGTATDGITQLGESVVETLGIPQSVVSAIAGISSQPFTVIGYTTIGVAASILLAAWFWLNGGL